MKEIQEALEGRALAFSYHFHRAIGAIAHPTQKPQLLGHVLC